LKRSCCAKEGSFTVIPKIHIYIKEMLIEDDQDIARKRGKNHTEVLAVNIT
jgi:hypothetical protein